MKYVAQIIMHHAKLRVWQGRLQLLETNDTLGVISKNPLDGSGYETLRNTGVPSPMDIFPSDAEDYVLDQAAYYVTEDGKTTKPTE